MEEVDRKSFRVIVWISYILSLVVPALSELCQYKGHSYNTGYSYGYVIRYRSCAHGCCGTTSYKYCCSGVSGQDWRTIGIGIGCTVAGLILLGVVICVCCVFRGRQSNKNRPPYESRRHRREAPGQRSRNFTTNSHCIATISDEHRDPVTRALPAYTPGPYFNEAYIHDKIDIPPSYEEAVSGDPVATPRIESNISQDGTQRHLL